MAAVRALLVGDAELAEEPGEAFGVHGLSCSAAGEQPAGVGVGGGVPLLRSMVSRATRLRGCA
jgi:hypothetical protein